MKTELKRAASKGDLQRVKQLVEGGANLEEADDEGYTALLLVCSEAEGVAGHFDTVAYLVDCKANVAHADDKNGMTTLQWACKSRTCLYW
jgi:ankyrin repeat protein